MKKVLFISLMLMIGMSAFSQRVNQQGKKLVKSIDIQSLQSKSPLSYVFKYDDIGNLIEVKNANGTLTFTKQGDNIFAKETNHTTQGDPSNILITTNSYGCITALKDVTDLLDGSGIGWELYEYTYDYDYEMGHYTLNSFSKSTWFQFNGKQPEMAYSNQYDRWYYLYNYGKLQTNRCVETSLSDDVWFEIDKLYDYDNIYDDTNLNLMYLVDIIGNFRSIQIERLPLITEWCPSTATQLPSKYYSSKRNPIFTYDYIYDENNLTSICICLPLPGGLLRKMFTINIEYYN